MSDQAIIQRAFEQGQGILRLAPTWVPRVFCVPGRRIKLHPDDYYAMGGNCGGIDERWFASTTPADNGPLTTTHEGLSFVVVQDGARTERALLRDAVAQLGAALIGERLWNQHRGWPMFSKFFDNQGPLPHHIHHRDQHAARVGKLGKPEAYYFPPQVNNHGGDFPYTFFGLNPGTTRDQIRQCLVNFSRGDNQLTSYSRAYRLDPGAGWDVPAGILHAPGSLCTYEPQRASDVFAMYQSVVNRQVMPESLLWRDTPPEHQGDIDYLMEVIDWDANIDPDFHAHHFMRPRPAGNLERMKEAGYEERWVCFRNKAYSAKELIIFPGRAVTVRDNAAYGFITMQGHGMVNGWTIETPALIRFGQLTHDEFFVSEAAARAGVRITNPSLCDPLVLLKHFGPDNPDLVVE